MTERKTCALHVEELRARGGVERVIVARVDGAAVIDDGVLEDRERAAASAASLAGIVDLAARALGLDETQGAVIYGHDRQIITRRINESLLLVVLAQTGGPADSIYPTVRRVSERIARDLAAA
ncbi:roadblock/LC7 domain-containing protein [uncultured Demequina sp.]|uniref:roadblock/LC7 domain-containing protein n=1 Tax=uncultured Demequina sp. TaxID=693499 RepID=UPI0025E61801|nr:roadblock/LC7 domain-containing protein [uncultured Demequina sp.]